MINLQAMTYLRLGGNRKTFIVSNAFIYMKVATFGVDWHFRIADNKYMQSQLRAPTNCKFIYLNKQRVKKKTQHEK